jgi:hypothetical protein
MDHTVGYTHNAHGGGANLFSIANKAVRSNMVTENNVKLIYKTPL